MSFEWPVVCLEEITTVLGDGLHGTPIYDDGGDYHFINGNNLLEGRIVINEKTKRVSEAEAHKYRKNLNERTILVSINGTLGNIAFYRGEKVILGKSACYFNVDTRVDKHFVRYVLQSDTFQNYIHNLATGSTIKNVSLRLMRDFSFQLPPFEVQKLISGTLKVIDDRITLLRETNATLEAIAQALFKSWFVDFDPVRAKQEGRAPEGMDEATAALFPDGFEESELGLVPRGWQSKSLATLMDIAGGTQPPASEFVDAPRDGYIRLIQIRDYETDAHLTFVPHTSKLRTASKEDIMIARYGASVGRICWGLGGAYNVALVRVVCELNVREFLRTYLLSDVFQLRLAAVSGRSAQAGFNKGDIASFKLVIPSQCLLAHYQNIAWPLRETILHNRQQSQTLANLRDTLLPRLISGQLRLPEAEAMIEDAV